MFVCEDELPDAFQGGDEGTGSEESGDEGKDSDKEPKKAFVSKHLAKQTCVNVAMYCRWIYER